MELSQPPAIQTFVLLMNLFTGAALIYFLFSVPAQLIRRFRRKKHGETVSPMSLIIKKALKYWAVTALIVIPISILFSYLALTNDGVSGGQLFSALILHAFIGNILTTFFIGYFFMRMNKDNWSYSYREETNKQVAPDNL